MISNPETDGSCRMEKSRLSRRSLAVTLATVLVVVVVASQVSSTNQPVKKHLKLFQEKTTQVEQPVADVSWGTKSDQVGSQSVCVRAGPTIASTSYGKLTIPQSGRMDGVVLTQTRGYWESWTNGHWVTSSRANWGINNNIMLMGMFDVHSRYLYPVNGADGVSIPNFVNGRPEYYLKKGVNPADPSLVMKFAASRAVRKGEVFSFGNTRMLTHHATITNWHRGTVCFDVFILYSQPAEPVTCVYAGTDASLRMQSFGRMRVDKARSINSVKLTRVAGKWESWTKGHWVPSSKANWGIANNVFLMGMTDSANRIVFPPATAQNGVTPYYETHPVNRRVLEYYEKANANPTDRVLTMNFPRRNVNAGDEFHFWSLRMLSGWAPIIAWHRGTVCFRVQFLPPPPPDCDKFKTESECIGVGKTCVWDTYIQYGGVCRECHSEDGGHCS